MTWIKVRNRGKGGGGRKKVMSGMKDKVYTYSVKGLILAALAEKCTRG